MENIETYMMELIDEPNKGLYCVSIVDDPAIQTNFIALAKELKLVMFDDEKRLICGAVLIPDIPIYRKAQGEQPAYYAKFSKETIEKAAISFLNRDDKTISVMHDGNSIEGLIVESYILKEDSQELDAPKGSWVMTLKIEDDSVWKDIKLNMLRGYSIEGVFRKKDLIKFNSQTINLFSMEDSQKLDAILEQLKVLIDAITGAVKDAPESVATEEMVKEVEQLRSETEALKIENAKLQSEKIESVKMSQQEAIADGFNSLIANVQKRK